MKICITGGSGFIGSRISQRLLSEGHDILIIDIKEPRNKGGEKFIKRNLMTENVPEEILECDAIIHLAGVNIFSRWTQKYKELILRSRIEPSRKIIEFIGKSKPGPKIFVSASAIGFYGDRGEEELNEDSVNGKDFLSEVCKKWEEVAKTSEKADMRWVSIRTGIVLGPGGGIIPKLLPLYKLFLGGPIGKGNQWFSWIYIDDLINIYKESIMNESISGPINAVSPKPVRNIELAKKIGKVTNRPSFIKTPAFAIRLILGELSQVVLASQKVVPQKLLDHNYNFIVTDIEDAVSRSIRL